jgi:hypothetical protein
MINRRFMIVPPAIPRGGRSEKARKGSKVFSRLQLESANMRELVPFALAHGKSSSSLF